MTSDADLARLCMSAYVPPSTIMVGSDLAVNVTDTSDGVVVAFRGTTNAAGWARDFDAVPSHNQLVGWCHAGFLSGACALMQQIDLPVDKKVTITGHSLGGALAVLVAALRIVSRERVDEVVTFGAPRAGYAQMAAFFANARVRQYRRGNDPVPGVPLSFTAFPYVHAREPLIQVGNPQSAPWNCHDIRGYVADVAKYTGVT